MQGISGPLTDLYDVFVDWPGRLGRELPGLSGHLESVRAERVLDLGCGTGRHVQALLERGLDAHGADVSQDMLERARTGGLDPARLHRWRLGDALPDSVRALAPLDAVIAMGNVWPFLVEPQDLEATGQALRELLRPGGLVLCGLKAFAVRRATGDPYLPLLKRTHEGRALWFVRFVDFDVPQPASGVGVCDLHLSIVAGEADGEPQTLLHRANRVRVWSPEELASWFEGAGFADVRVSGRLDDPDAPPRGEDVFVRAVQPS